MSDPANIVDPNRDQLEEENQRLRSELAKAKRGATNHGFVQVSRKYLDDLDQLSFKSPAARKVLTCLVKSMNKQNAVMVSVESLAKLAGLSTATVKRATAVLREQRWLETYKVGTANAYRINSEVFWTARADGRWASFAAQVILNFDEQDAQTKGALASPPKTKLRNIPIVEAELDEDVIVTGTGLGSDEPPEQSQLDFHKNPS